ncbi:MAG: rhamnulose-1-phosphate aldolase [Bacilli bacterium]|nr:rhamnulose-1-phosphate aldolase [Bacilli bacterium]
MKRKYYQREVIKMSCVMDVAEILDLLYKHGWDERNGGNLSYLLEEEEVRDIVKEEVTLKTFHYNFDLTPLIGKYLIITGTGKYFKNCLKDPSNNLGIMKVTDAHTLSLLWGYDDGGRPTSEAPTHLKCHIERLKVDSKHRIVIHCHPTNVICMTHVHDLDSAHWTKDLWKMQTESIVVFPEGIAVLPWILCGGEEIGEATAYKMKEYRSVVWAQHGLFCTGRSIDEAFGLIETIEKAAEIYIKICDKKIYQTISDENLQLLAHAFNIDYRKGIID